MSWKVCVGVLAVSAFLASPAYAAPGADSVLVPGTAWVGSQVLTPQSPTDFTNITFTGVAPRQTFDRRTGWVTQEAQTYLAAFSGSKSIEVVVDPELRTNAADLAEHYARMVGQLPRACRTNIDAVWLHPGDFDAGGGNRSLLIHTDYGQAHADFMEEVLLHECAHTSLDSSWQGAIDSTSWTTAATADGAFVSSYARNHPDREDIAESFLPYIVTRLGPSAGWSASTIEAIRMQIPHRLAYLDSRGLDLAPLALPAVVDTATTTTTTTTSASPTADNSTKRPRPRERCSRAHIGQVVVTASFGRLRCVKTARGAFWSRVRR